MGLPGDPLVNQKLIGPCLALVIEDLLNEWLCLL